MSSSGNVLWNVLTVVIHWLAVFLSIFTGLKEKTERKLKEVDAKNRKLTPWQEYKEKRAKKKLEKKEARAVCC